MLNTVPWYLVLAGPYVLLAVAGALLWTRRRSFATLLIALGFAATLVGEATAIYVSHDVGAAVRTHQDAALVLAHHHRVFSILTHYATLVGLWMAAVGLFWHAAANR